MYYWCEAVACSLSTTLKRHRVMSIYYKVIITDEWTDEIEHLHTRKQLKETTLMYQRGALGVSCYHFSAYSFESRSLTEPGDRWGPASSSSPPVFSPAPAHYHTWLFHRSWGFEHESSCMCSKAILPVEHIGNKFFHIFSR